jgi:hypothetical protein
MTWLGVAYSLVRGVDRSGLAATRPGELRGSVPNAGKARVRVMYMDYRGTCAIVRLVRVVGGTSVLHRERRRRAMGSAMARVLLADHGACQTAPCRTKQCRTSSGPTSWAGVSSVARCGLPPVGMLRGSAHRPDRREREQSARSRLRRRGGRASTLRMPPGRNGRAPAYRLLWGYRKRNVVRRIRVADSQTPVP